MKIAFNDTSYSFPSLCACCMTGASSDAPLHLKARIRMLEAARAAAQLAFTDPIAAVDAVATAFGAGADAHGSRSSEDAWLRAIDRMRATNAGG